MVKIMAWFKNKILGKKKETTIPQTVSDLSILSHHATKYSIAQLDDLVHIYGKYPNRSEAIRTAIRDLLRKEHPNYVEGRRINAQEQRKKVFTTMEEKSN